MNASNAVECEAVRFAVCSLDESGGGVVVLDTFSDESAAAAFGVKASELQGAFDAGRRVELWREVWRGGRWQRLGRSECGKACKGFDKT